MKLTNHAKFKLGIYEVPENEIILEFNLRNFKKRVDSVTGSILFYRDDVKGLPEKVYNGDGFTVEIKNGKIYLIDIFNSEKVLRKLLKNVQSKAA